MACPPCDSEAEWLGRHARWFLMRCGLLGHIRHDITYSSRQGGQHAAQPQGSGDHPGHLRAKHNLREGDDLEIIDVDGTLQTVRAEDASTKRQRLVRRL